LGALSAALMAAPAFAGGNCAGGNCAVPVHVLPSMPTQFGPLTIQNQNPLGHLRTIDFQRAPHVSITRVHGLAPTATLSDAPSGFTGGCHPSSTTYCRQGGNFAAPVNVPAPVFSAPVFSAPVFSAPVFSAPVFSAPIASAPRVVRTGGGYDASKFTPRTYGDASFVPGVAYLPTSTVVRDPAAAQQVLDTGRAVAQPVVVPGTGTAPNLGMVRQNLSFQNAPIVQNTGLTQSQGLFLAPTGPAQSFGPRVGQRFGQAGKPLLRVPVAVQQTCQTPGHQGLSHAPHAAPVAVPNARYGQATSNRWSF